jgi:small G protein signaling modulator 3
MSHQLSTLSLESNNNNNNIINKSSKIGYWPGHLVAERLTSNNNETIKNELKLNNTKKTAAPFSAITNSMQSSLLTNNINTDKYDEFGFKKDLDSDDEEDTTNTNTNTGNSNGVSEKQSKTNNYSQCVEDPKHKLKWMAYLEFTLNSDDMDIGSLFNWEDLITLNKCEKLKAMIRGQGIPHSLRSFIWMRLSGAYKKKIQSKFKYGVLLKSAENDLFNSSSQIEKDLLRTLPSNICFNSLKSVGVARLRRILQAIAWLFPNIGYCQGMGTIVATLLLFMEEEDVFWLTCSIIEEILPASYYSHTLIGVQLDMYTLKQLIKTYLPEIDKQLTKYDIELSLICINWFLTIFSNVLHPTVLLRIWDLFFYDGSAALFQLTLAMLKLNEAQLTETNSSSSQIFR